MAGYAGYSKSNNAVSAEAMGRHPISAAIKLAAKATGLKSKLVRQLLMDHCDSGEWHHTSKFYNRTNYYDVTQLLAAVDAVKWAGGDPTDARLLAVALDNDCGNSGHDDDNKFRACEAIIQVGLERALGMEKPHFVALPAQKEAWNNRG